MDPDANLRSQADTTDPDELRELRHALAEWLAHNGFPPRWRDHDVHAVRDFIAWATQYRPDLIPRLSAAVSRACPNGNDPEHACDAVRAHVCHGPRPLRANLALQPVPCGCRCHDDYAPPTLY